ncbi:hypothetical protein [Caldalkalibacillus mannanilyticus]|uniref:hypothetical protein n=1 Tax=Caldalkalibacillus mannanilyticus TaxID=1418 RepID=UPI000467FC83|nr:hypothetical protein [Caldalkalibacillus mannanilyticus]
MTELLNQMAKSLEVSTKEYFTHPSTLKNYKEQLMVQKAVEKLYENGIVDHEKYTLDLFIKDLKKDKQDKMIVDLEKDLEKKSNKE